jgi:hypothetical protein
MHHRLAERELGVLVVEGEPLGAGPQRRGGLTEHLVRPGDQGVQLPRDRVAGRRECQAVAQGFQRPVPIAPLDGDRAEIEEDERLIGPVLQLFAEDPRIAFELSGSQREVDVTRVPDDQVGPSDGNPGPAEGRHDLLVDAVGPADVLPDRE